MVQSCLTYLNYRMIQIMRQLASTQLFGIVFQCGLCGEKLDILSVFDILQSAQCVSCIEIYLLIILQYARLRVVTK